MLHEINRRVSLDEIARTYPSSQRNGSPWFRGVSGEVLKAFAGMVRRGMHSVETGVGFSSLAFIIGGAHHTAIDPDDRVEANIRRWCDERDIDHTRFRYVCAKSQDVVPHLEDAFDFACIGGEHAFPMPMIDFYYLARRLKVGGYMAVDGTNIWTGDVIAKQLALDDDWACVSEHDQKTSIFRLKAPFRDKEIWSQPYLLANSKRLPSDF